MPTQSYSEARLWCWAISVFSVFISVCLIEAKSTNLITSGHCGVGMVQVQKVKGQGQSFNQSINQLINGLFCIAVKSWINTYRYNKIIQ